MADETDRMTVREVARECRRTTETVRRWIWEGKLPAQKLGNQLFIKREDLARVAPFERESRHADRLAVLEKARALQDRIRRRIGGTLDILEALDRSRASHP
jgi:excisionase family DNA binding protein